MKQTKSPRLELKMVDLSNDYILKILFCLTVFFNIHFLVVFYSSAGYRRVLKYFRICLTNSSFEYFGKCTRTLSSITSLTFIALNAFFDATLSHEYCDRAPLVKRLCIILHKHFPGVFPPRDTDLVFCMRNKK